MNSLSLIRSTGLQCDASVTPPSVIRNCQHNARRNDAPSNPVKRNKSAARQLRTGSCLACLLSFRANSPRKNPHANTYLHDARRACLQWHTATKKPIGAIRCTTSRPRFSPNPTQAIHTLKQAIPTSNQACNSHPKSCNSHLDATEVPPPIPETLKPGSFRFNQPCGQELAKELDKRRTSLIRARLRSG
jgi:hypothetical protein